MPRELTEDEAETCINYATGRMDLEDYMRDLFNAWGSPTEETLKIVATMRREFSDLYNKEKDRIINGPFPR